MNGTIRDLKPSAVWKYFDEICQIPRPSKHEEKMIQYLLDFGRGHNLSTQKDLIGNVLICKPASPGYENRKTVVLQSHIDMVCEKNQETQHDFFADPILPFIEGGWVRATGTTLGADDGIGVAAQLALLASDTIAHGPIECLFTVDEETGLSGAYALREGFLKGRILLNLDSEDEGELFIGCAGGMDTVGFFEYSTIEVLAIAYNIEVKGLKGGHSGDDIHKGRGNAVKIMNRLLWFALHKFEAGLIDFEGGNLRNAIAREAFASITLSAEKTSSFEVYFDKLAEGVKNELHTTEPDLEISLQKTNVVPQRFRIIAPKVQEKLLNVLYACPHGVVAWSQDIPGLVETSTNLASVRCNNGEIEVTTSQRSSVDSAKRDIEAMVESVMLLGGAQVEHGKGYPGWQPNTQSEILRITKQCYIDTFGEPPLVKAIHAGLECGLFLEKYPDMDMISFGPTIRGAHSPDERLSIETTMRFWDLLRAVLQNIPVATDSRFGE